MNKKEIKNSAQFWAAIVIVIFGCALVAYACKTPPPGDTPVDTRGLRRDLNGVGYNPRD